MFIYCLLLQNNTITNSGFKMHLFMSQILVTGLLKKKKKKNRIKNKFTSLSNISFELDGEYLKV